jgi:hypothetical protein
VDDVLLLKGFFDAVTGDLLDDAKKGIEIPNWRLVNAVTKRAWAGNLEKLIAWLSTLVDIEDVAPRKLASPKQELAAVQRKCGDDSTEVEVLTRYITKPTGAPQLATGPDPRKPINPSIDTMFGAVAKQEIQ